MGGVIFLANVQTEWDFKISLALVACHISAESCVSEFKLCFRNSQNPYLKAYSIFKKCKHNFKHISLSDLK